MWREPGHRTRMEQRAEAMRKLPSFKTIAPDAMFARLQELERELFKVPLRPAPIKVGECLNVFMAGPLLPGAIPERFSSIGGKPAPENVSLSDTIELAHKAAALAQALRDIQGDSSDCVDGSPVDNALTAIMKCKGWRRSGAGHFSIVFTKGDLAIKVGTKAEDSGAAYAAWARDNQELPGVPTIYDLHRAGRAGYTVVMPKYYSTGHYGCASEMPGWFTVSETADRIRKYFKGVARIDLHGANVMKDFKGNLIITDPVSFDKEYCGKYGMEI